MHAAPTLHDIVRARHRLRGRVRETLLEPSPVLSQEVGAEVHLKWENQQVTGSFKVRGALNAVDSLSDAERQRGVVAASSGNHATGLSWAAVSQGVSATIVVPESTPRAKQEGTRRLGAELIVHGEGYDDAEAYAKRLADERGALYVPSYDDPRVIAGAGTVGLESLLEQPDLDAIVVPVGGGGLISGIATAAKAINPGIEIIGVQPEVSPKFGASFAAGHRVDVPYRGSWADGLPGDIGELNLQIVLEKVDAFETVSEQSIARAVAWLSHVHHQMVEGSGVVGVAALQEGALERLRGKKVMTVMTGGNIDGDRFTQFLQAHPE